MKKYLILSKVVRSVKEGTWDFNILLCILYARMFQMNKLVRYFHFCITVFHHPHQGYSVSLVQVDRRLQNSEEFFFLLKFFFKLYIGIQLINNVVIVSDRQQTDSATYIHLLILSPSTLYSHLDCHVTLSRIPSAIQWVLSGSLSKMQQYVHVYLLTILFLFRQFFPSDNHKFVV